MRILLFGEYSNVHHTLCEALRRAGHEVLLVSDGDGWKDYPRDIDLRRRQPGPLGSLRYLMHLAVLLPRLRGFDVVQIINPVFLDVKARWNRWMFDYLRRNNRLVSVGCFGDDTIVIEKMKDPRCFEYSDFQAYSKPIEHENNQRRQRNWFAPDKAALTHYVMGNAHCLIACLYEYYKVYHTPQFCSRLHYIPLPVVCSQEKNQENCLVKPDQAACHVESSHGPKTEEALCYSSKIEEGLHCSSPVHILFAAQKKRAQMKGTDQLEPLFDRLASEHPDCIRLHKIESVPFAEYQRLVAQADVVVDQLYSYTPAMGALESMRQGKVVISGFETEYAHFLQKETSAIDNCAESGWNPTTSGIINLRPFDDEGNYAILERILTNPAEVSRLKQAALAFVCRYHDADQVAASYLSVWSSANGVGVVSSSSNRSSQR